MSLSPTPILTRLRPSALAAAGLLAAIPGLSHADPHTTIAGHGAGGQYIGNAGSYASAVAQSFDFASSQDRFIGLADYGLVGFSYAVSGVGTPSNNYSIGAFYRGGFTDTFSVASSSLPFGTDVLLHVHVSLTSNIVFSDNHGGDIHFYEQTISAEADGGAHTLTVSQSHPNATFDYDLHALVGYSGWQIGAGFANQVQPAVAVDYTVSQALPFSATWDLLPAHGYGLRYTIATDPGVSLSFASGHNYTAAVPEPADAWLWMAGLAGLGPVWRRRRQRG